ncbi:MAG: hypothetical protein WCE61_15545 [Candidatus Acidiferrum sp.]
MKSRERPIGITALSVTAFATSPAFVLFLCLALFSIYTKGEFPSVSAEPLLFVCLYLLLALFAGCFLALAWLSFVVGRDLWRLKDRGRQFASVSAVFLALPGIIYLSIPGIWWKLMGATICAFSLVAYAYLQSPSTKQRFEMARPKTS